MADHRDVTVVEPVPRLARPCAALCERARRPTSHALSGRRRELETDEDRPLVHMGRRVGVRSDVGLGACHARQGRPTRGLDPDQSWRLEHVRRCARCEARCETRRRETRRFGPRLAAKVEVNSPPARLDGKALTSLRAVIQLDQSIACDYSTPTRRLWFACTDRRQSARAEARPPRQPRRGSMRCPAPTQSGELPRALQRPAWPAP